MIALTGGYEAVGHVFLCLCSPLAPLVPRQGLRRTKEIHQLLNKKNVKYPIKCYPSGHPPIEVFFLI